MKVRQVVTGHDRDGKAVFASDELLDPITVAARPGRAHHRPRGAAAPTTFPDDGGPTPHHVYFPAVDGYRFGLFTVLPGAVMVPGPDDPQAMLAEMEEKLPGFLALLEPDNPGMH